MSQVQFENMVVIIIIERGKADPGITVKPKMIILTPKTLRWIQQLVK